MFNCQYCNKEFETKQKLGGHILHCKLNPKYEQHIKQLEYARSKRISILQNVDCYCQYCNKLTHNFGALQRHENSCIKNPNHQLSKTQQILVDRQYRKENGIKLVKTLSNEHKDKIRQGLLKWKESHNEEYMAYCRKKSKCQENFKNYLKSKNISFIEEYCPYPEEKLYSLDISWPDEKIAIEINGSQHYNSDGSLNDYTLTKQKFFEDRGWKIIQIYYKQCYNIIKNEYKFEDILNLPIYNKDYVLKEFDRKKLAEERIQQKKIMQDKINEEKKKKLYETYKLIFVDLKENSNIDFSKIGWVEKAKYYLNNKYGFTHKNLSKHIKKYYPEFFDDNVYSR